ncbi:TPA: hypothetical protein LH090_002731 [Salmonella enterica subsp. enterica serovar Dublin]|nr:hypothetical protein [Salmonella enterica subsp. enterica serovar Dublin]
MPRFAANLSMMFTEVPFIERFAAAAEAGCQSAPLSGAAVLYVCSAH